MAQIKAELKILPILEPYLERKDSEYWAKSGSREPTLPLTPDMKVDVRNLVKELMEEPNAKGVILESHQQHFFNKDKLYEPVNALCMVQGVGKINSRNAENKDAEIVRGQIAKIKRASKSETETMAEVVAENARLKAELASLRAEKQSIQETGAVIRSEKVKI